MNLCKAKIHECLCLERVNVVYTHDPRILGVTVCYDGKYSGWLSGVPSLCRQHSGKKVVDVDSDDEPKKKRVKKERRG